MVFHLATRRGIRSLTKNLWYRPGFNARVRALAYEDMLERSVWPRGAYLFTDFERMTPAQRGYAEWLFEQMSARPEAFRVLNHPTGHVPRFELLRELHAKGQNDFNVFALDEIEQARTPLFLRYRDRHIGSLTPLLRSRAEIDGAIAKLAAEGEELDRVIAVEYVDVADSDGLFRKYGAFRVGDAIVPRHLFISTHWEVKIETNNLSAFKRREEYAYLRENPHEEEVMRAFEASKLEFGRIDYAFKNGRMQVWEVNDNPQMTSSLVRYWRGRLGRCLLSLGNLDRAFAKIEQGLEPGPEVEIDARRVDVWRALCAQ
jgi:hypothetical protein